MSEKESLKSTLRKLLETSKSGDDFNAMSERLRRKISRGLAYPGIREDQFYGIKMEMLSESILDPIQKERAPFLFGRDEKLLPEAKRWIEEKLSEWKSNLDFEIIHGDVKLYGSSSGYQYTDTSDVDLHVVADVSSDQLRNSTGRLVKLGFLNDNGKNEVTLFIIPDSEKEKLISPEKFENIYNVRTGEWEKKTEKGEYEIPYPYIMELSEFFMNGFDLSLSDYERSKQEFIRYTELDPNKQEISEKEKNESVSKALTDLKASHDKLRMSLGILKSFLNEGYEGSPFRIHITYNEKKDPRMSVNNAIYKMLEKFGYQKKVSDAVRDGKEFIKEAEGRLKDGKAE
jgi:hypothetical protein